MRRVSYSDRYVNSSHVAEAMVRSRIVAILATCSMGKSTSIDEVLTAEGNPPVMFVACRIVHALDGSTQFGLDLYNSPNDAPGHEKRSTTIHSLHKYDEWFKEHGHEGILVLDELRSILACLNDKTFKDRGSVALLDKMMKQSRVIAADADLECDGTCEHFLTSFGTDVELIEYTHKPNPRTIEAVCGNGGYDYWKAMFELRVQRGENLFLHINSVSKASEYADFCARHGANFKLYTSDCTDSKDDFKDPDSAWEETQVIITTSTVTVAVDPKKWHCDHVMIYAGAGYGCSPRDQGQGSLRIGRRGIGAGPGMLSNPVVLTYFDKTALDGDSTGSSPTSSPDEIFDIKLKDINWKTQRKRRKIDENHDIVNQSSTTSAPAWLNGVLAWQDVEDDMYRYFLLHVWEEMCERRGWEFVVRIDYDALPALDEAFDHGGRRVIPGGLHGRVHAITLTDDPKKNGGKYDNAVELVRRHFCLKNGFDRLKGLPRTPPDSRRFGAARDFVEDLKKEARPDCYLTKVADIVYTIDIASHGPLSGEEYRYLISHYSQYHEQRSIRSMSLSQLNAKDQEETRSPQFANLRYTRAVSLMQVCRMFGFSFHDAFERQIVIPDRFHPMFEVGYNFDDDARSLAYSLQRWLLDWSAASSTPIKEKQTKSEMQVGLQAMFTSFGIGCKFSRSRAKTLDSNGLRPQLLDSITIGDGHYGPTVTRLVEKSLVKSADGGLVPFKKFEWTTDADATEQDEAEFQTVGKTDIYKELIDVDALMLLRSARQDEVDRLQQFSKDAELLKKRKAQLTNLCNMIAAAEAGGVLQVQYHRGFGQIGRRYSSGPSLQKAGTCVRATSKRWYYDIDIMNAHPAIVAFLVSELGAESDFPSLVRYGIASKPEREEILSMVMAAWQCPRKVAKQLFCSLLNTGTVDGWQGKNGLIEVPSLYRPEFVQRYEGEASRFVLRMADEHPDIVDLSRQTEQDKAATRRDPNTYHKSRALNVKMQEMEDAMLSTMEKCAIDEGWQFDCLIYDGALLRKRANRSASDVAELLGFMSAVIEANHGIQVTLSQKEL